MEFKETLENYGEIILKNGINVQKDEIGFNESTVHLDFMIGSEQLNIIGILPSGEEDYIFKKGKWA